MEKGSMMTNATERLIFRWIHIIFGLPILGYIYGPPSEVQQYVGMFRLVFVPVIVLSGLWMWQGHALRRLVAKRSVQRAALPRPQAMESE